MRLEPPHSAAYSTAADHVINNKNHPINFYRPEVLASDNSKKKNEIKETLLAIKHSNLYNKISHELMVFN